MSAKPRPALATVVQLGAGLIGWHLAPLLAKLPGVRAVRLVDRDVYEAAQWAEYAGQPKAVVLARLMRSLNARLAVEALVGDIESLPLGRFRGDVLLTGLDSRRARLRANTIFQQLAIPFWIDAGVSSPSLVRISVFAQDAEAPCYECGLNAADYAAEQAYPCQASAVPPPSRSPEFLGALAAGFQAAALARLLAGDLAGARVHHELVFDVASQRAVVTRLRRRPTCFAAHRALSLRVLRRSPRQLSVAGALALGARAPRRAAPASLFVPGLKFVRELVCACGVSRPVLGLQGRLSIARQTCPACRARMTPLGFSLTDHLALDGLSARERALPLSALGLWPAEILGVQRGARTDYFELGPQPKVSHDRSHHP